MRTFYQSILVLVSICLFQSTVSAKAKYTVRLAADSITYQVFIRPDQSFNAPFNTTNSAQVTFVVPTGGFKVGNLTSLKGNWTNNVSVVAPVDNPAFDYFAFALQGSTTQITYSQGVEVLLFTFRNTGKCTGELNIIETTDPFYPPNTANVASGNQVGFFGGGPGNSWSGNYKSGDSDCTVIVDPPPGCQDVWDDTLLPDSLYVCGICGTDIPLNYTGDSIVWSPTTDMSCDTCPNPQVYPIKDTKYTVRVPAGNGCFRLDSVWIVVLPTPVFNLEGINPTSCSNFNGEIIVHVKTTPNIFDFSLNNSPSFQNDTIFSGLDTGLYQIFVRDTLHNCRDVKNITLTCDTIPILPPPIGAATVAGIIFKDCVSPGLLNMGEQGLAGFQVLLTGFDSLNLPVSRNRLSAPDGTFLFDSLRAGTYQLKFFPKNGLIFSPKNLGSNPLVDSDADPITGITTSFTISSYQNLRGMNAGLRDTVAPQITPVHPWLSGLTRNDTLFMQCGATTVFGASDAVATDNCDPDLTIEFLELPPQTGDCAQGWLAKMYCGFRATDNCGNKSEWWFHVFVVDTVAPVFAQVPANLTINSGQLFPAAAQLQASDFCTQNLAVIQTDSLEITTCDSILHHIWTTADPCGNTTQVRQSITRNFCNCKQPVLDSLIVMSTFCGDESGVAEIRLTLPPENFSFNWLPNFGLPNAENNRRTELSAGKYLVFVADKNNPDCFLKIDISISDTCACVAPAVFSTTIVPSRCGAPNGSIVLDMIGNESDFTYSWIPQQGISSNYNASLGSLLPGNYLVFVSRKNVDSCFIKIDIQVPKDTAGCVIDDPNQENNTPGGDLGFSPNGDFVNDFFVIPGLQEYPNHTLIIYNRWGNSVFTTRNYEQNWDGEWKGRSVPDGSYLYMIVTDQEVVSGWVQINRG
jgi:gliding motility-associated-like protein